MSTHFIKDGEQTMKQFVMDRMDKSNITEPGVHYKLRHGDYGPYRIRRVNKRVVFIMLLKQPATL